MKTTTIIISGINMTEGGIFTILDNCLQKISTYSQDKNLKIIALVNDKTRFNYTNIEYLEFPKSKKSWLMRIYYEYFYFKKISKKLKPDIWFSLHDTSPNVFARKRYVYYHHPTIFYKANFKDWKFDYKIGVFSILYKFLFRINIKKNNSIFVQQHWIKDEFKKKLKLNNIIVCNPEFTEEVKENKIYLNANKIHFFFPSFPRTFKNFEIIFNAIKLLKPEIKNTISIHFTTIKGNQSRYANYLYNEYKNLDSVVFWGLLSRAELLGLYSSIDCLLFPSKLETWGLPISEAKAYNKPMLVANLPYAKETVGDYEKVSFFNIEKPKELAQLITNFVDKTIVFDTNKCPEFEDKQLNDWNSIFEYILKE